MPGKIWTISENELGDLRVILVWLVSLFMFED